MANAVRRPGFWMQSLSGWVSILRRFKTPEPVEVRAERALKAMDGEPRPRRDLAILQLRHDHELVADDESANLEVVRAVQVRFLALANEYPIVAERVDERFRRAPIAKLFAAVVVQAHIDGATVIEIGYREPREDVVSVRYLIQNEWQTAMEMPHNLFRALRGFACLVDDVSFQKIRGQLYHGNEAPSDIRLEFSDERTIRIEFIA